jgi:uncharacterized protein (DUF362 family)
MYGDNPDGMVPVLMDHFDVADRIPTGASIGIKPNLVVAKPSSSGATTDPWVVGAVIAYLQRSGFRDIAILESAWLGDCTKRAFEVCGYHAISEQYGVPLLDLKDAPTTRVKGGKIAIDVCSPALDIDFLINMPVLKAHCQTKLTCALKNLKGVIPDSEKQRFHTLGLHRPIAALSSIVKSDFIVVDGIIGDLSHEEGGNPVQMNRILVGEDPVLMDAYAATLLGFSPADIGYIGLAEELGVGTAQIDSAAIRFLNAPSDASVEMIAQPLSERFSRQIDARGACSPCFASLVHALVRMGERVKLPRGATLSIGQEFKEKSVALGIGSCTRHGKRFVRGCPPTAQDIVAFLETLKTTSRK